MNVARGEQGAISCNLRNKVMVCKSPVLQVSAPSCMPLSFAVKGVDLCVRGISITGQGQPKSKASRGVQEGLLTFGACC
mgnify:CR=1 FL=1